jgi:hypothetical protein
MRRIPPSWRPHPAAVRRALVALGLIAALAPPLSGGAAGVATTPVAPSKVEKVLLYSTQARVFRAATVALTATSVESPVADLPQTVVQDTVRVECKTAEVARVEVTRAREHLPRQVLAKELTTKIEALADALRALGEERAILRAEIDFIGGLRLQTLPAPRDGKPAQPEGLFVDTWRKILTWSDARAAKLRARLLAITTEEKKQERALHKLQVEAQGLNLPATGEPVLRVVATLKGKPGKHRVVVSYLVTGVRWRPSYDLSYDSKGRAVDATYYALVSQQTGEDWTDAELRLSTGQPLHLVAVPELPTWTLGRKQDFTPQPRQRLEPRQATWVAPAPAAPRDVTAERLLAALSVATRDVTKDVTSDTKRKTAYDVDKETVDGSLKAPPRGVPADQRAALTREDEKLSGEKNHLEAEVRTPAPARPEARPAMPSVMMPKPSGRREAPSSSGASGGDVSTATESSRPGPARESLPWTDQGYSPPPVDPDSPAAGAEGYLFTLYAPGRHAVTASGVERRIPVMRKRFAVKPVYRILPGLSPSAYLMAGVYNNTGKPILRGNANLFSGSMFSGNTWLNTALPGKTIELPLGVDDAVKVVRHLRLRTVSQGVVFKDDITEYTIDIEVANHRRYAIQTEVEDQVPVKEGRKIEVRSFSSATFAKPDEEGKIRWKGQVGASSVKKLSYSFRILRPKDWELQQHDD